MSKYKTRAAEVLAQLGVTASLEDNDLNINIQAEHEGDADNAGEGADLGEFDNSADDNEPAVEETVAVEPVDEEALVADTSGTPETAELDVAEADAGVAETATKMEEVNEAVEGLESLAVQIATLSLEGREVSPATAAMINSQYDFITRNFPKMQRADSRVASCEAYASNFEDAHTVSLEAVMDKIKNGGKAFWKWFKELCQKIAAFFGHALSGAAVMGRKAKALSEKAGSVKEWKEVKVPELLGKNLSKEKILELAGLLDLIGTQTYGDLAAKIKESSLKERVDGTVTEAIMRQMYTGGIGEKLGKYSNKVLVGNIKIHAGGQGTPRKVESVQGEGTTVTLNASEAKGIAEATAKLASAIDGFKRTANARRGVEQAILNLQRSSEDKEGVLGAVRKFGSAYNQARMFERALLGKALAVGNAANNVVARSMGKGEGKGDESTGSVPQLAAPKS